MGFHLCLTDCLKTSYPGGVHTLEVMECQDIMGSGLRLPGSAVGAHRHHPLGRGGQEGHPCRVQVRRI